MTYAGPPRPLRRAALPAWLLPALLCLAATGCLPLPGGYALTSKRVMAKEGDAVLVADDGSRCKVPPRTFVEVQVGRDHTCVWKETEWDVPQPLPRGPRPPSLLPPR